MPTACYFCFLAKVTKSRFKGYPLEKPRFNRPTIVLLEKLYLFTIYVLDIQDRKPGSRPGGADAIKDRPQRRVSIAHRWEGQLRIENGELREFTITRAQAFQGEHVRRSDNLQLLWALFLLHLLL